MDGNETAGWEIGAERSCELNELHPVSPLGPKFTWLVNFF